MPTHKPAVKEKQQGGLLVEFDPKAETPGLIEFIDRILRRAGEQSVDSNNLRVDYFARFLLPEIILPILKDSEMFELMVLLKLEALRHDAMSIALVPPGSHPMYSYGNELRIWQARLADANSPGKRMALRQSRLGNQIDQQVGWFRRGSAPEGYKFVTSIMAIEDLKPKTCLIIGGHALGIIEIRRGGDNDHGLITFDDGTIVAFEINDEEHATLYYFWPNDYQIRPYEKLRD